MSIYTLPPDSTIPLADLPTSAPNLSHSDDSGCPARFIQLVVHVLVEHDLPVPEHSHLAAIAKAALAARHLFFSAAFYKPNQVELDSFFESFVLWCASRT